MAGPTLWLNAIMANNCGDAHDWFRTVVDRFEGPLVRYAKSITGDTERARDVVQEAFLRLHREFTLSPGWRGQGEGVKLNGRAAPSPRPSPVEGKGDGQHRPENVQAWLYTVCRRQALDVLRKETRMKTLDHAQAAVCECPLPTQVSAVEHQESQRQLLRLLADLPANQQEVVRLKFQDGLSYRDIAAITGLTSSNVGYLLHVALKRFREQLAVSD
jgi:RNA polymerase sigma factor (sigma-70 family)